MSWVETRHEMVSDRPIHAVLSHLDDCRRHYGTGIGDCSVSHIEIIKPYGTTAHRTFFRLTSHTYTGWKTAMLMGGCFAMNPKYEG